MDNTASSVSGNVTRWTGPLDEEESAILTGPELKAIRRKLGLTQAGIGELVFVEQSTWSDYERGKVRMALLTVERLKKVVSKRDPTAWPTQQRGKLWATVGR